MYKYWASLLPVGFFVMNLSFAASALAEEYAETQRSETAICRARSRSQIFARTELFFGRAKPDGTTISDGEFYQFLDEVITPRFPHGLTAVAASGQFRGANGSVTREGAVFVILLYPVAETDSDARIEEIRTTYRSRFKQESVLRIDDQSCVSF
ncbi:MAG: DUF3574 domain-containing protein [Deltaproteobacteria bacterium]|nr:DUF3574 domain-containing protein [Deltaproteobacteria bacterium]